MADQEGSNIIIEKVNPERASDVHEAIVECGQELYETGNLPQPQYSLTEVESNLKNFLKLWEKDDTYLFHVIDTATNQFVGNSLLNQVHRNRQAANLSYWVRTSYTRQGIATKAACLVARYGFEKLGLQRIEIVVSKDNTPSLRVAEKLGACREGLLRNRLRILGSPCDAYMHSLIPSDFGIDNIS